MKLLADLHISPRTVTFLGSLGHDVIRADALLPTNAADEDLIAVAVREERTILTQDMDFSAMIALAELEGRKALRPYVSNAPCCTMSGHAGLPLWGW